MFQPSNGQAPSQPSQPSQAPQPYSPGFRPSMSLYGRVFGTQGPMQGLANGMSQIPGALAGIPGNLASIFQRPQQSSGPVVPVNSSDRTGLMTMIQKYLTGQNQGSFYG